MNNNWLLTCGKLKDYLIFASNYIELMMAISQPVQLANNGEFSWLFHIVELDICLGMNSSNGHLIVLLVNFIIWKVYWCWFVSEFSAKTFEYWILKSQIFKISNFQGCNWKYLSEITWYMLYINNVCQLCYKTALYSLCVHILCIKICVWFMTVVDGDLCCWFRHCSHCYVIALVMLACSARWNGWIY